MKSKQRNRALKRARHGKGFDLDNVGPKIGAGLTFGASAEEALKEHEVIGKLDGSDLVQHMADDQEHIGRIPRWRAVLADDTHSVWHDEPTGRLQRNVIEHVDPDTHKAYAEGHICLRCKEPQPEAFPEECDVCGYPMRERQAMDVIMEFRGDAHVGPGAPIADYLAEQDERLERLDHEKRKAEGSSPMQAVTRRILSPGAKRKRGLTGNVHADPALVEKAVKTDAEKK